MNKIAIAIHGGAGTILKSKMTTEKEIEISAALDKALTAGYEVLKNGGTSIDAVERAVIVMEDSHLFNAGKGSVFTSMGTHEMDASIMDGKTLNAGSVALVSCVKNPISLAKMVMLKSEHVFLAGKGAEDFAKENGCQLEDNSYFYDEYRYEQLQSSKNKNKIQLDHADDNKYGTVGAVALDSFGDIAAATSTGGMTNKKLGRIGDSPLIGAGTYANNQTCAVSCTGTGELFIRQVAAYDVSCLIEHKQMSLQEACNEVINNRLLKINGKGGLIAIDASGNISMPLNTKGMYRGSIDCSGNKYIAIYK